MPAPANHVKMSELARRAGVPAPTIKHYVAAGLLPPPIRTHRNMAYYDLACLPRIGRILELKRDHFLPLKEIKRLLDAEDLPSPAETVAHAVARVHARAASTDRRTRAELLAQGMPARELDQLTKAGILTPERGDGELTYAGDDLELLRVLGAARRAGLTAEMLPSAILADYVAAIRTLAEVELEAFERGVIPRAPAGELGVLTEAATRLSERLVLVLRRKLLAQALAEKQTPPRRAVKRRRRPRA